MGMNFLWIKFDGPLKSLFGFFDLSHFEISFPRQLYKTHMIRKFSIALFCHSQGIVQVAGSKILLDKI